MKYRPGYPAGLLEGLSTLTGFTSEWQVADIGSGTGKLTELFLLHGNSVVGVEPNLEMRQAGEEFLSRFPQFVSVDGTAEATDLEGGSFDLVIAGQAFHWFDVPLAKREFQRILKPGGWVALIWNDRRVSGSPFLDAYEQLLRTQPEYEMVGHKANNAMNLGEFFESDFQEWSASNWQDFYWDGLLGRAMSSSYVPPIGHPDNPAFVDALQQIYDKHSERGLVAFSYETKMFLGKLS